MHRKGGAAPKRRGYTEKAGLPQTGGIYVVCARTAGAPSSNLQAPDGGDTENGEREVAEERAAGPPKAGLYHGSATLSGFETEVL